MGGVPGQSKTFVARRPSWLSSSGNTMGGLSFDPQEQQMAMDLIEAKKATGARSVLSGEPDIWLRNRLFNSMGPEQLGSAYEFQRSNPRLFSVLSRQWDDPSLSLKRAKLMSKLRMLEVQGVI